MYVNVILPVIQNNGDIPDDARELGKIFYECVCCGLGIFGLPNRNIAVPLKLAWICQAIFWMNLQQKQLNL